MKKEESKKKETDLDDINVIKSRLKLYEDCSNKRASYLNSLTDLILGPNYYNMMMDYDSCEKEEISDCKFILTDPFVRFFIKRAVKKYLGFTFNPHRG